MNKSIEDKLRILSDAANMTFPVHPAGADEKI